MMPDLTAAELFRRLDRELWLLTARAAEGRGGLIATFVNQASLVPDLPRVLVGIARQHHTWKLIEGSSAFALHLLSEQNLEWVWRFGLSTGLDHDKFAGLEFTAGPTGSPILDGALGWLDCRVEATLDTGDRTVYLAEVVAAKLRTTEGPLTVKQMLALAPDERRTELKEQIERDCAIDASAIEAWRRARREAFGHPL
ncbi:MAG: flavin reductase family protein [Isosphaeraceae bacterium]|nr:flavin reductase family protein [Isosphaeraceae bacterium]